MRAEADIGLAQLTRRLRPALVAYFLRRVGGHAEAEDLTQDVFMRLTSLGADEMRSADAYVFRIAANLLADRSRRNIVRRRYAAEQMAREGAGLDPLDPDRVAAGRRSLAAIAERLGGLPERTRTMFVLYRVENMNKRAIADAFGLGISTVEKEVGRAMAHLMLFREDDQ